MATSSDLELKQVHLPDDGVGLILENDIPVIFVDASDEKLYTAFESSVQEKVGLFSDRINANAIHFLTSHGLEESQYLVQSPLFGHFLMRNYGDVKEAGQHYGRVVRSTLSDRAFGLSHLLSPKAKIQTIKLSLSSQKLEAVEAVKSYLLAAKFQNRMASIIANAVDELLMNAMFDAPCDDIGKPTLSATPRTTVLRLEGKSEIEAHVGYDGNYVAISAIDHFGSIDKAKLLSHIRKSYTSEEYKVRTSVAGAGIGLATVFRSGGSFFFVSESKVRTEVTVFFKRADSFRDFKDQFRFISTQFYF